MTKFLTPLFFALISWSASTDAAPISAEEFEAYVTGKTLFYEENGMAFGAEIYHPNRRVTWSFLDGNCMEGVWYELGTSICFIYDDLPAPQCWAFEKGDEGLRATFLNDTATTPLYEAKNRDEELICLGPEVGV